MKHTIRRLMSLLMAVVFIVGTVMALPLSSNAEIYVDKLLPFTDVSVSKWYYRSVRRLYSMGVMAGTADRQFSPSGVVTRSMFATVLAKAGDAICDRYPDTSDFTDVRDGAWYTRAVNWASENSYMAGYGDGSFGHADPITREQIVLALYGFACRNDYLTSGIDMTATNSFPDRDTMHDWGDMKTAMCWAVTNGLITGTGGGLLAPREYATRAQLAQLICNLLDIAASNSGLEITIAGNPLSLYSIIYSDANSCEVNAAKELREYIIKTNGCELPLCLDTQTARGEYEIIVGHTDRQGTVYTIDEAALGDEGFSIKSAGNSLCIAGGAKRGTMYGVYEFIEQYLGWRFYTEGFEVGHDLGDSLDLSGIDDTQIPDFEYRDVHMVSYCMDDISVKRRMNGAFHRRMSEEWGGTMSYAGGDTYFSHTLNRLAESGNPDGYSANCCFNPKNTTAYSNVIKNVQALLKSSPSSPIIGVTQMDTDSWCSCEDCSHYSPSDMVINLANAVGNAIKDSNPDTRVLTLAYHSGLTPGTVKPASNVIVEYCPINMSANQSINGEYNKWYRDNIVEWSELCADGNLYLWDYPVILHSAICPNPDFYAIYESIREYRDIGVNGIFAEGRTFSEVKTKAGRILDYYQDGEFNELRAYLYSKLLWNADITEQEYSDMIDEFMQDFYGEGWQSVRRAFDVMHTPTTSIYTLWTDGLKYFSGNWTGDMLAEMEDCFDAAYNAAQTQEQRNNVARARAQVDAVMLSRYWNSYIAGNLREFTPEEIVEINERLYRTMVDLYVYPKGLEREDAVTNAKIFTETQAIYLIGGNNY